MFRNYVPDDYPDLTYNYYRVVQFPTCLTSIIERLSSTSAIAFTYVGDCIQCILLLGYNCRLFNTDEGILAICTEFEKHVLQLLNEFFKKGDKPVRTFKNIRDLQDLTFKVWPPGKVPAAIINKKRRFRQPYREEADQLIYRLSKLPNWRQTQLIGSLVSEIQDQFKMTAG